MTQFNTKYAVGQTLFFLYANKVKDAPVRKILIDSEDMAGKPYTKLTYVMDVTGKGLNATPNELHNAEEKEVFASKEELIKSL
jgi:hypothetical protein